MQTYTIEAVNQSFKYIILSNYFIVITYILVMTIRFMSRQKLNKINK